MTSTFTLDESDLPRAIDVVAHSVGEIPLYQWLLGDHVDDPDKRAWLAELIVKPLLRAGYAVGAEEDGRLVGVLAWQPHDADLSPDGLPPLTPADVEVAAATPGLRERLVELWTEPPLSRPHDDAVCCVLTSVTPESRGARTLLEMMETIQQFCLERRRPFYAWTGSPALRDWFKRGWGADDFGTVSWNGVEMYGVVTPRPSD